jgi:prepilin-type N-terminal cleavage/methylation domain-containing protein
MERSREVRAQGEKRKSIGSRRGASGFTLIELTLVMVLLSILAVVAIPRVMDVRDEARREATRKEMMAIRQAIVGERGLVAGGRRVDGGYEGDVGSPPPDLDALLTNPGVAAWNRFTRRGWRGPYISSAAGDYTTDAWGDFYLYDPVARTVTSTAGGGSPIIVDF